MTIENSSSGATSETRPGPTAGVRVVEVAAWVAAHNQGGAVTFPTRAGQVALQVGLEILKGNPVLRGTAVASEYVAPADIGMLVSPDAPDDWWASKLPAEFLPKQ